MNNKEMNFGEVVVEVYCKKNEYLINLKKEDTLNNLKTYMNERVDLHENMEKAIKAFLEADTKNEIMVRGNAFLINLTHDDDANTLLQYGQELEVLFREYAKHIMKSRR